MCLKYDEVRCKKIGTEMKREISLLFTPLVVYQLAQCTWTCLSFTYIVFTLKRLAHTHTYTLRVSLIIPIG